MSILDVLAIMGPAAIVALLLAVLAVRISRRVLEAFDMEDDDCDAQTGPEPEEKPPDV